DVLLGRLRHYCAVAPADAVTDAETSTDTLKGARICAAAATPPASCAPTQPARAASWSANWPEAFTSAAPVCTQSTSARPASSSFLPAVSSTGTPALIAAIALFHFVA